MYLNIQAIGCTSSYRGDRITKHFSSLLLCYDLDSIDHSTNPAKLRRIYSPIDWFPITYAVSHFTFTSEFALLWTRRNQGSDPRWSLSLLVSDSNFTFDLSTFSHWPLLLAVLSGSLRWSSPPSSGLIDYPSPPRLIHSCQRCRSGRCSFLSARIDPCHQSQKQGLDRHIDFVAVA